MKIRTVRILKDHRAPAEKTCNHARRMHAVLVIVTIAAIAALLLMHAALL